MEMTKWRIPGTEETFYAMSDPNNRRFDWKRIDELAAANAMNGWKWFAPATLRWFGSKARVLVAGAVVEFQENAPEGMKYRTTWFDERGDVIASAGKPTRSEASDLAWLVRRIGFTPDETLTADDPALDQNAV